MAVYEYICCRCGRIYEIIVSDPDTFLECECGGYLVKGLCLSNFNFRDKGWYKPSRED